MGKYDSIRYEANLIKNESSPGANTAERVGLEMVHVVDALEEIAEKVDSDIDISEKEYQRLVDEGKIDPNKNYYIFEE